MSKWHRVEAELRRLDRLGLNLRHTETRVPGEVIFAFDDDYAAALIIRFLHLALHNKRPPVLIHNGRKPR